MLLKNVIKNSLLSVLFFGTMSVTTAYASTNATTFNLWEGIPYRFVEPYIENIQNILRSDGDLDIPSATGYFGDMTKEAVIKYQIARGMTATGVVGSLTRRVMNGENINVTESGSFSAINQATNGGDSGETEHVLDVPLIEQLYPLSCETASLQMALQYKGVTKTQDELIDLIGTAEPFYKYVNTDGTITGVATSTTIWGDPDQGFVGNIRGWLYTSRNGVSDAIGWGVNPTPVNRVAHIFRPDSGAKTGGVDGASGATFQNIIDEITAGNPVIVWEYSTLPDNLLTLNSFTTPAGKVVRFVPTHVKVVVGFKKESDGSYILLINDPEYGRLEVGETEFMAAWNGYYDDMVVVR